MRQALDERERRIAAALVREPRASWGQVAHQLGISERTVARRAAPLYADGTMRATALQNPSRFPDLNPMTLRVRCHPGRLLAFAETLARRTDTISVDVIGGGREVVATLFVDGPQTRRELLLRELPSMPAVMSWAAHPILHFFRTPPHEPTVDSTLTTTGADLAQTPQPQLTDVDMNLITALADNGRAGYAELARSAFTTSDTARRRLTALLGDRIVLPATEIDLTLLGLKAEAMLWLNVHPGAVHQTAQTLLNHPHVRYAAATTGQANLVVAVAMPSMDDLFEFVTDVIGPINKITAVETTPIMLTIKRSGLLRQPHCPGPLTASSGPKLWPR